MAGKFKKKSKKLTRTVLRNTGSGRGANPGNQATDTVVAET